MSNSDQHRVCISARQAVDFGESLNCEFWIRTLQNLGRIAQPSFVPSCFELLRAAQFAKSETAGNSRPCRMQTRVREHQRKKLKRLPELIVSADDKSSSS